MMIVGAATLLEIAYRLSTQPESGTRMKLFWIPMDAATPWPWLGAAAVALPGFFLLRRAAPRVRAAWDLAADPDGIEAANAWERAHATRCAQELPGPGDHSRRLPGGARGPAR